MKKIFTPVFLLFVFYFMLGSVLANEAGKEFKHHNKKADTKISIFHKRCNNPNTYAKQYAAQNGISFEEAKEELKAKYGNPKILEKNMFFRKSNPYGLVPEEQELLEAGVPLEVIKEGDNAIRIFIDENNISNYTDKDISKEN